MKPHVVTSADLLEELEELVERAHALEDEAKHALGPVVDLRLMLNAIHAKLQRMIDSLDHIDAGMT